MSKEKTPTGFTDDQLRTVAKAWADDGAGMRMAESFAQAAAAISEACKHMDRFLTVAEEFRVAFEDESVIPDVDPDEP
ncbi:MAG TPA: hypothetical protein VMW52_12360, partial [Phycisphaerae bacterium]|nr:hypothetical protein [Phycisphaerae bacterium]